MKPFRLLLTLVCGVAFLTGAQQCLAQLNTPYLSADAQAIAKATTLAKDSIGSDAMLTFIGTVGHIDTLGLSSEFNLDNGKAGLWGYIFYSPSTQKTKTIGVVSIPVLGYTALTLPIDFPAVGTTTALSTTVTYGNSDKMVAQLKTDTTFAQYHKDFPSQTPDFLSLGNLATIDSVPLPISFNTNQELWTISFIGSGSMSMTCFVGASDGSTYCRRVYIPTLDVPAASDNAIRGTADVVVAPNPANGRTRVSLDLPSGVQMDQNVSLALFDAAGAKVLDLTGDLARSGGSFVEFDSHALPAGVYFVRAFGSNWVGVKGVVVQH